MTGVTKTELVNNRTWDWHVVMTQMEMSVSEIDVYAQNQYREEDF